MRILIRNKFISELLLFLILLSIFGHDKEDNPYSGHSRQSKGKGPSDGLFLVSNRNEPNAFSFYQKGRQDTNTGVQG